MNRTVLSLLVSNQFGVLTRVTNLFSQRGFNIDTLAVGETENPKFSRITITTRGNEGIINQIKLQLAKLEDVKIVQEIRDDQLFIREVLLIKVEPPMELFAEFEKKVEEFHGRCQIIEEGHCIVELTDTPASVDYFIEEMRHFHIREISRTGGAALQLSIETVY